MRVTTDFWVSALLRKAFASGGFAAVLRRGSTEAGAVFIVSRDRFGQVALHGPAPQTSYDDAKPDERLFTRLAEGEQEAVDNRFEREVRFDPDVWLVEIEADVGSLIELVEP